jgi:excisionase family DNA binding protein
MVKVTTGITAVNTASSKHRTGGSLLDVAAVVRRHPNTPADVSQATGMSEAGIRKAIRRGDLEAIKVGKQLRISNEAVAKWLGW